MPAHCVALLHSEMAVSVYGLLTTSIIRPLLFGDYTHPSRTSIILHISSKKRELGNEDIRSSRSFVSCLRYLSNLNRHPIVLICTDGKSKSKK